MKALRQNKVIGLAVGERSILAAEVTTGERTVARCLAEFPYSEGISFTEPAALGKALAQFLREKDFSARPVVVGLPARWLVVKTKEVPPADSSTLSEMLRLQAEGEFSSELKDLVYDYTGSTSSETASSVLLVATPQKYVAAAVQMCESAKLNLLSVMPSSIAVGVATGRAMKKGTLVLTINDSAAELTSQDGDVSSAVRHLRPPSAERPFVGELRRAVSGMPNGAPNGSAREMVVWNSGYGPDATSLSETLGMPVRFGELPVLGIEASDPHSNGQGRKFAAAVSLALAGTGEFPPAIDFLHTRLAPPKQSRIPRWVVSAVLAVIVILAAGYWCYSSLQTQQGIADSRQKEINSRQSESVFNEAFVSKVSFAQGWHGGNPRYLACFRDLTDAMPQDNQTYATSLILREAPKALPGTSGPNTKPVDPATLIGTLVGKTSDQQRVQALLDRVKRIPNFSNVELPGTVDLGRSREVAFTITFKYLAVKTGP